jgi:hypothetical protein
MSVGCIRNVSGKAHSGKDHRYKGAKKLKMQDGTVRAKGIVTYPGGDRVDWVRFDVPEGKEGRLKIRLRWRPPRPGLDLAFRVYDQYFHRVARAKPTPKKRERTKRAKVRKAEAGTYYIQIYAPTRMDAGKYRLRVTFKERKKIKVADAGELLDQIPDPPKLPAVPEPPKEEPKPPGGVGPGGQPPGGVGPGGQPPGGMPPGGQPPGGQPPGGQPPAKAAEPVLAKVTNYQGTGGGYVIITVNKGKNAGVERGWGGKILKGRSKTADALEGGEFKVIKVTSRECIGKVRLSVDRIKRNRYVLLTPSE